MADYITVLNTIKANASQEYQNRIPDATKTNIQTVGNALLSYQPGMNEFIGTLMNRIALVVIQNKIWNNPLGEFKKGMLEYGESIEEVFVDLIKAQKYDPDNSPANVFKRELPKAKTIFHKRNRQDKYVVTISHEQLRTAFLSYSQLDNLVNKIIEQLYNSDKYDEFLLMKELMTDYTNHFTSISVPAVSDEKTAKTFTKIAKALIARFGILSPEYNEQGVYTACEPQDCVLFVTPEVKAEIDVEVLSIAFNIDKAEINSRIIVVDNFGSGLAHCQGLLVDKAWFMVYDTLFKMETIYNPDGLYYNNFLHHWQILSTSQFANAIAFIDGSNALSIALTGATTASTNSTEQYTATVTADPGIDDTVTWSLTGNVNPQTSIDENGLLTINTGETADTLTVRATSNFDPNIYKELTVTIS